MKKSSPLMVIFTTVFMDLVGFGMIIPLQGLYGKEFGASGLWLGTLGAAYPLCQFFFAPLWGRLSDRHGRRPIILMSLLGSTLAYLGFALSTHAGSFLLLILTRCLQGAFAANISAAQAYIADVTPPHKRAQGMGLIGAAFGIGFVLGPVLGGLAAKFISLPAPGYLAAGICGLNLLLAWRRLEESLSPSLQAANRRHKPRYDPLNLAQLRAAAKHPYLGLLLIMSFLQTTAFGAMEQTFALFFQSHFSFPIEEASVRTAYVLGYVGLLGAAIQGGLIRRLAPRYGERRLLMVGLALFSLAIFALPFGPNYASYFLILLPLAVGRSLIDPSTSALVSRAASQAEQGRTFGTFQGLASLARVVGPFAGLTSFEAHPSFPFLLGGTLCAVVFGLSLILWNKTGHLYET